MKTYTRRELHELVWSYPMRDAAKKLGMSDNGLRKHCLKAFVPLPPQGHWNKVHAGQQIKTLPLPPRPPGITDAIQIGAWDYKEHERNLVEEEPVAPAFDEPIETLRERIARNVGIVIASKNLAPPHAAFRRQFEDDARRTAESRWHTPGFDTAIEKRRLRILQGLFYGLSRLDCSATVQGQSTRTIFISVGHQQVSIALEKIPTRRKTADGKEMERLKFSILKSFGSDAERCSWADSDDSKLEDMLSSIAVEIIVTGELKYREHLNWVYEQKIRRREELQQKEIERRERAEKAERERLIQLEADRLTRLTDSAEDYHRAQKIRAFVQTISNLPNADIDRESIDRWKAWAISQANKLDPVATGRIWDDVKDL